MVLVEGQNLVPNPSFEYYTQCPWENMQLELAYPWRTIYIYNSGSVEYYNYCSSTYYPRFQIPRTGSGYAGLFLYVNPTYTHEKENLQIQLKRPLIKNKKYCVRIYMSLHNLAYFATSNVGALFSDSLIFGPLDGSLFLPNFKPQIYNYTIISDTSDWFLFEGSFIANGGEKFMIIGSFVADKDANAVTLNYGQFAAYYFFDDISVYPCDAPVYTANGGGKNRKMCPGDSIMLGSHNLEDYLYSWFRKGNYNDTLSTNGTMWVKPDSTSSYVLKVKDFKLDETADTVTVVVNNENCFPTKASVFPNPTFGELTFQFDNVLPTFAGIKLYNALGQILREYKFAPLNNSRKLYIDIRDLSAGVYFYKCWFLEGDFPVGKVVLVK